MVAWSLAALRAAGIADIVVAVPQGCVDDAAVASGAPGGDVVLVGGERIALGAGVRVVAGGAFRSASVRAALAAAPAGADVVVHDAARPLVDADLFARTLAALAEVDCAVAAARVTDTIKEAEPDGRVAATLERSRLWAIQTPQAFRRAALQRALAVDEAVLAAATDDAGLVERAGGSVRVIESSPANLKVTTLHDLRIAEHLLADRVPRPPAP